MNKSYNYQKQRGVVLVLLAIGMIAIVGIAGLAIDVGHGNLNKGRLQSAVDAAALSGARTLMITRDTTYATDHVTDAFTAHLEGEMTDLDMSLLTIQYAPVLAGPYGIGAANSFFVRVGYAGFDTAFTFASVLPGIDGNMAVAASAVAGPSPLGSGDGEVCDLAPVMMCGDPDGDDDCSDGECFGLNVADNIEYQLKRGSGGNGGGGQVPDPDPTTNSASCGRGCAPDEDCLPAAEGTLDENGETVGIGPGNFQLARIDPTCPGGNCVRDALAGADSRCSRGTEPLTPEPGNTVGPVLQGLGTRFGQYRGGMSSTLYPPDPVTTNRCTVGSGPDYWYEDYVEDTKLVTTSVGIGRRILPVPIVTCPGDINGASTDVDVLGFGCFFLTRETVQGGLNNFIYGQFIGGCEASGTTGENPGPIVGNNWGPWEIVLYNDPNPES